MTRSQLSELLKYSSPHEIYVITHYGVLIRLFCPFKVKILQDIGALKSGQTVLVQEIKVTLELKTVYIIDNDAYYYHHFNIEM
jgi:Fe-S cluster assembly ATPase SufC